MRATSMPNQIFFIYLFISAWRSTAGACRRRILQGDGAGEAITYLYARSGVICVRVRVRVCLGELPARGDKPSVLKNTSTIRSRIDGLLANVASSKLWIKSIQV